MYDDIIVPTDGGEQMDAVIDAAVDIATQRGARVHALSVIDRGVFLTLEEGLTDAVDEELTSNAERAVEAVTNAASTADLENEGVVRRGRPGEEIIAYADEIGADLIVMGSRGADGHERRMLGSVSQDVITETDCQTLVIPLGSA
ncbi:UspA domain protein [Natronomonas moolapensis 8.8.11]|uniref:UspA domain protein n=1 Tax=Natronomonas moolapensis (strain DSM 18674 / CECT 7526 / JCM 14361 / 8.8.11) TaxID=268739 RepID=M1XKB0_NATM8|nr:universal stress protein [Natronomonas moolapensis]CCQ35569.1 UspA domain protein [Natronomonas moolapensis 8.8.11]